MNLQLFQHPLNLFWLCTIFHLIADYHLQGILADMKQKDWWNEQIKLLYQKYNGTDKSFELHYKILKKYKYDYLAGLFCHSIMWGILTFLPLMLVCSPSMFACILGVNILVHSVVDHMKANIHLINLCEDQIIHMIQIIISVIIVSL